MAVRVKIVLDADVLIHFAKADRLTFLPEILPEYDHVVLDVVYNELKTIREQLDHQVHYLKNIRIENFIPVGEMAIEYAMLMEKYGAGESACISYCHHNNDVIGSSNLRDIANYCTENKIVYITTIDFLYYAYARGRMTADECRDFISTVVSKGSKLPMVDIEKYVPKNLI